MLELSARDTSQGSASFMGFIHKLKQIIKTAPPLFFSFYACKINV